MKLNFEWELRLAPKLMIGQIQKVQLYGQLQNEYILVLASKLAFRLRECSPFPVQVGGRKKDYRPRIRPVPGTGATEWI